MQDSEEQERELERRIDAEESGQEAEFEEIYFRSVTIARRKLAQGSALNDATTITEMEAVPVDQIERKVINNHITYI